MAWHPLTRMLVVLGPLAIGVSYLLEPDDPAAVPAVVRSGNAKMRSRETLSIPTFRAASTARAIADASWVRCIHFKTSSSKDCDPSESRLTENSVRKSLSVEPSKHRRPSM